MPPTDRRCEVDGCDAKHAAKGMCQRHYLASPAVKAQKAAYRAANREKARARNQAYWLANRERLAEQNRAWQLAHPERMREISREWIRRQRAADPVGAAALRRAQYQTNKERTKALKRQWLDEHPERAVEMAARRRALLRGAPTFVVSSRDLLRLRRSPCVYCGAPGPSEVDHVVPLSRGGSHGIGNLAPSCGSCNRSKGARLVVEWRARLR